VVDDPQVFAVETTDLPSSAEDLHFGQVTAPLPLNAAADAATASVDPAIVDHIGAGGHTGDITDNTGSGEHDRDSDQDSDEDSDEDLNALLAELSLEGSRGTPSEDAGTEDGLTEDAGTDTEGQPEGFSHLLRPPSLISPTETTIIDGLPAVPIETPIQPESFDGGASSRFPTTPPGPPEPGDDAERDTSPGGVDDGRPGVEAEKFDAEVFGSETSVFPAVRTRRGDIIEPQQSEGSWFTRSTELPSIRVEEAAPASRGRAGRVLRRLLITLFVLAIAGAGALVALQPFGPLPFLNN
jgi:hypothetical protein